MKKLLFLFCLLSWSVLHAQKTINRPPFIAKATETIEIAAIHLSDTATVVDVDAKFIQRTGYVLLLLLVWLQIMVNVTRCGRE